MAKNVERILNKLQSLCEEKAVDCATDFAQHENWLLSTFKTSALQKLTRPKVELACPTSTKKQKTSEAPMQPAPEYAETADMQTDSIEELAQQEVRLSTRNMLAFTRGSADMHHVLQPKPAPVAAPDPDAAAKLAAAMAAAMGNDAVDQGSTATERTSQKTTDDQPSEVRQMDTASATRTPVAANVKPDKDPLISPDSPQEKKPTASVRASQPTSQANPVPAASERQTVPTPHRTLSATEQLSRLRQRLAGIKTGSTPSQPANPGGSKLHSTEKAALIHPAPVEEEAAEPAPVEAAAQQAVGTATTASVSRNGASTSAAQTHTAIEQGPGMVKHDDSSQKRDLDQVEHTDSMPKKTKLDGSTQQVPGSPAPATDLVQSVDTNSGTDRLAVDNSMLSAASQRQDTESEQQKKAAPALALNMAVEDKLAMAAARRQQMEVDQATERTKDNEPVASSSTSGTDQSKKRCAKVEMQLTRRRIVAECSRRCNAGVCRSHPEDVDGGQKRAKAPSTTSAGTENMTVGTDKVLMPPPPPSASKKTPLKTPSSSYNSTANSYATEMKP